MIFYNDRIHNDTECTLNLRYDKILLAPGVYDEQIEISSKIPFEIVGEGDLGQVSMSLSENYFHILTKIPFDNLTFVYWASFMLHSARLFQDSNFPLCCIISRWFC